MLKDLKQSTYINSIKYVGVRNFDQMFLYFKFEPLNKNIFRDGVMIFGKSSSCTKYRSYEN